MYDFTFATPVAVTSGTIYCIGSISGGPNSGAAAYYYDHAPANVKFTNRNVYASSPSNPFGMASADNYDESVCATFGPQHLNDSSQRGVLIAKSGATEDGYENTCCGSGTH